MFQPTRNDLLELLKPIQHQLLLKNTLFWSSVSIVTGIVLDILILFFSRFIAIPNYRGLLAIVLFLAVAIGLLLSFLKRPNLLEAAQHADQFGLNERVVTAYTHRNDATYIAEVQRQDAQLHLQRSMPKLLESIKIWTFGKRKTAVFAILTTMFALLLFLPNPMDEILAMNTLQEQVANEAEEKLKKAAEEVKENKSLTEEDKTKFLNSLEQLQKQLKETEQMAEKEIALKKANEELAKMLEEVKSRESALTNLNEAFSNEEGTKALMEAFKNQNQQAIEEAKNNLEKALESMSEAEKENLKQLLKNQADLVNKQAEELEDKDLANIAEQLNQAAAELEQGNLEKMVESMQQSLKASANLSNSSNSLASQLNNAMTNISQSQVALAKASSSTLAAGNTGSQANSSSGTETGSSGSGNGSSGAGTDNGENDGAGNSGDGSGNGDGSGAGSGNGSGSGLGGNGSGSGGSGAGIGAGNHELVTVPSERIKSDGITDTVSGPLGNGDSQTRETLNSQVTAGIPLPYNQVYQQYEEFARKSIQQNKIPSDYQEYVKEYFSHIEP